MPALTPNSITINRVELFFNIPIYQRLFTWGDEQITVLIEDLWLHFLKNKGEYHIGVMTVVDNAQLGRMDLVDGQQRMTVLVLLGIILRRYYPSWDRFLTGNSNNKRLDFCARPDDSYYVSRILGYGRNDLDYHLDLEESDGYVNEKMRRGMCVIRNHFNAITSEDGLPIITRFLFAKYIYENTCFFIQKLPADYTPKLLNKHFESMNSTGRNLENHEILKVRLLETIETTEDREFLTFIWNTASNFNETVFPAYEDKGKDYENKLRLIIGDKNLKEIFQQVSQGQTDITDKTIKDILDDSTKISPSGDKTSKDSNYKPFLTFTDFLLHVLFIMLNDDIRNNIIIQEFFNPNNLLTIAREYIGKNKEVSAKAFIENVGKYRIIFDYYILRIDGNGAYNLLSSAEAEHDKLEQYQAMLFSSTSRYTYYQWIPFILKTVKDNGTLPSNDEILGKLKIQDSENNKLEEFTKNSSFGSFKNYYFRRLDYYIWERVISPENVDKDVDKDLKTIIIDYKFHQYNSIEHLHPRSQRNQDIWDKDKINSFGNLALISESFNSSQGDDPMALKFARIKDQIEREHRIESIKLALMYYSAEKDSKKWTPECMEKHEEKMKEILVKSYPEIADDGIDTA